MTTTLTFGESVARHVAAADQQYLVQRLNRALPPTSLLSTRHQWYQTLGQTVLRRLTDGTSRRCPHVGPGRYVPMYSLFRAGPMEFLCRECWLLFEPRYDPVENMTCDRCSVYARGLASGALPIGLLLLIFGVCRSCATELGAEATA